MGKFLRGDYTRVLGTSPQWVAGGNGSRIRAGLVSDTSDLCLATADNEHYMQLCGSGRGMAALGWPELACGVLIIINPNRIFLD